MGCNKYNLLVVGANLTHFPVINYCNTISIPNSRQPVSNHNRGLGRICHYFVQSLLYHLFWCAVESCCGFIKKEHLSCFRFGVESSKWVSCTGSHHQVRCQRTVTFGFRTSALAKAIRCRCPPLTYKDRFKLCWARLCWAILQQYKNLTCVPFSPICVS